jgi:hypothetical protein
MSLDLMPVSRHPEGRTHRRKARNMTVPTNTPIVAIRLATEDDAAAVTRLAALDSARVPAGQLLLGIVDGEARAAVAIATGEAIADPFHPTADVVALLRLRADRLRSAAASAVPTRRRRLRSLLPA